MFFLVSRGKVLSVGFVRLVWLVADGGRILFFLVSRGKVLSVGKRGPFQASIAPPRSLLLVGEVQVDGQLVLVVVGVGPEGVAVDPLPGVAFLLVGNQGGIRQPASGSIVSFSHFRD